MLDEVGGSRDIFAMDNEGFAFPEEDAGDASTYIRVLRKIGDMMLDHLRSQPSEQ